MKFRRAVFPANMLIALSVLLAALLRDSIDDDVL
jgi:hypothetical protein